MRVGPIIVLLLIAAAAFSVSPLQAQPTVTRIPRLLSFQGILVLPNGQPYANGEYTLDFKLYYDSVGGQPAWEDVLTISTVSGVFSVNLGEKVLLDDVDFTRQLWLEMWTPGQNAQPFEPRQKLTSAPYAMYAQDAVTAGGLAPNAFGAVLSLNGQEGELEVTGTGGLIITQDAGNINIDASGVIGNLRVVAGDSVIFVRDRTGEAQISVRQNSIDAFHLKSTGVISREYGGSVRIPRITVDEDGRITGAGETVLRAGEGVELITTGDTVTIRSTNSGANQQLISGHYVNTTGAYQYQVTVNTNTATPVATNNDLKTTARIMVSPEGGQFATAFTITQRTANSFTVDFSGGIPPGSGFSWMILNL